MRIDKYDLNPYNGSYTEQLAGKPQGEVMESEYQVLSHLQDNEITSQRKISGSTGLSLGMVNLLLKKMVRKGFVKVEKLSSHTIRYILTPQGMNEKIKLTGDYIRKSYRQIISITSAVEQLLKEKQVAEKGLPVIIYGPGGDEIEEILIGTLDNMKLTPKIIRPTQKEFKPEPNQIILTWRYEDEASLNSSQVFNIMTLI